MSGIYRMMKREERRRQCASRFGIIARALARIFSTSAATRSISALVAAVSRAKSGFSAATTLAGVGSIPAMAQMAMPRVVAVLKSMKSSTLGGSSAMARPSTESPPAGKAAKP